MVYSGHMAIFWLMIAPDSNVLGTLSSSGRMTRTASASPCSTLSRTSGQEDPAHDHDPHQADNGRDEARVGAVRCPEPTAQPRGAAQQDEQDGSDPRREECVRDQPGPPEPERLTVWRPPFREMDQLGRYRAPRNNPRRNAAHRRRVSAYRHPTDRPPRRRRTWR
jgi:hypothetical protein